MHIQERQNIKLCYCAIAERKQFTSHVMTRFECQMWRFWTIVHEFYEVNCEFFGQNVTNARHHMSYQMHSLVYIYNNSHNLVIIIE